MSAPFDKASLEKLKAFVDVCKKTPQILHLPELEFFKSYIESLGGKVPEAPAMQKEQPEPKVEETEAAVESEPESDLELDTEGCIEPDEEDPEQEMGDPSKEVSVKGVIL